MADKHIRVTEADAGKRLDQVLRGHVPGLSRAAAADAIAAGQVRVNGARAKKGDGLRAGDVLELSLAAAGEGGGAAPDAELSLPVLYEDEWLVVVDKPAGVPSAALRAGETGTAASALLARYPEMASVGYSPLEPGLLHRLDTNTSGTLLAARDAQTFAALRAVHERGEIDKTYVALCTGRVRAPQEVQAYLRADQKRVRVEQEPFAGAKPVALKLLSSQILGEWSLIDVSVALAARHQVRAQLAAIGHAIAADALYGGAALPGLSRHFLHASRLCFTHPRTRELVQVQAPLPEELGAVLALLSQTSG